MSSNKVLPLRTAKVYENTVHVDLKNEIALSNAKISSQEEKINKLIDELSNLQYKINQSGEEIIIENTKNNKTEKNTKQTCQSYCSTCFNPIQ